MAKKTKSRYALKEKLGEGGMGVVWRAHDTILNTDVALKMLLDVNDTTALRLFYEECHKQSGLAHPNIVEIRDVGSLDEDGMDQPYLVMPLLRGATLSYILRSSSKPLVIERVVDIFSQACRGLQAAHDSGLLHRDIKPSNLFILDDDSVKIIDFGVAHRLDVSRTMSRKGTLLYMSPEQLSMKPLTRAADVFSLAVVCYEVLTCKQPFSAATEDEVIQAILHVNPPPASSINSNVSVALGQVVCKAMAKDPRHRFASAKEFGDYLRRAFYDDSLAVFDPAKFAPRLEKATAAYHQGNLEFAQELVNELESEGYLTDEMQSLAASVRAEARKKTIERLLESARARVQDGEYRLALQRVHEVLQLEPRQEDALVLQHDIEARRAEADIADWLRVGQQHLEKCSFLHAKQAAQRILETRPQEERALQFLSQIERRESEVKRLQEHKREVYSEALEAEKRNEITLALTRMKRVLDLERQAPESKDPGQLAVFQSFYNRLHSEHEAIASSYAEAKLSLERGEYAAAIQLCDRFLEKFPQHTLFKALKFDSEQRWRRAISVLLIKVEEAAEKEPDLDRRIAMLEEVALENPEVSEFSRLLQGTREKRNLVNGIVARARELASRELYGEALVQWDTLQTIYPEFPGLGFEIENVRLRRQLAERTARKNHWIEQTNELLEAGEFDQCLRLLATAAEEFPEDSELAEMKIYIRQQQEMAERAELLIKDGRRRLDEGELADGLAKLRSAYEIGSRVRSARTELIEGLLFAARASQADQPQARTCLQEILDLEPSNHAATGLLRFLDEQAEYEQVDKYLSQARQLLTNNELDEAASLLVRACAHYPRNARLLQMQREVDVSRGELRTRSMEVARRKRLQADTVAAGVAAAERDSPHGGSEKQESEFRTGRSRLHTIAPAATQTAVLPVKSEDTASKSAAVNGSRSLLHRKLLPVWIGVAACVLLGVIVFLVLHRAPKSPPAITSSLTEVNVHSTPSGAHILQHGQLLGVAAPNLVLKLPAGKTQIEVQMDNFETQVMTVDVEQGHAMDLTIALKPLEEQLHVAGRGALSIDGASPTVLSTAAYSGSLTPGTHELLWTGKNGYKAIFHIDIEGDKPAALSGLTHTGSPGNVLLISTGGQRAHLYTGSRMPVTIDGAPKRMEDGGTEVELPAGFHEILAGNGPHSLMGKIQSGAGRLLQITFDDAPVLGSLTVVTNVDGAHIKLLRGTTVVSEGNSAGGKLEIADLPRGSYTLQTTAPSSDLLSPQVVEIKRGQNATVTLNIHKTAVLAALRVHTLPAATIQVDGMTAGITDSAGLLVVPGLSAGQHHLSATRSGRSSTQDVTLAEGEADHLTELKLDRGPGSVTLQLDPVDSAVIVYDSKGQQVSVSGSHFELPAGRYHFIARTSGYVDRGQAADVVADSQTTIDLKLSPISLSSAQPSLEGWEGAEWSIEEQSKNLVHSGYGVGLYAAKPATGRFLFSGTFSHGFILGKPKVEWVANYRDANNYLLFSLDRSGLEMFTVTSGKKTPHGAKIPVLPMSKFQMMVQISPGSVDTSFWDGHRWKQLSTWTGLPADVDTGRFGFKGYATLTSFSYVR
jgi:tRNA A-37 threonylcarbamoyl transferase component Bud32/uncharacterized protein (UPF0335 family)